MCLLQILEVPEPRLHIVRQDALCIGLNCRHELIELRTRRKIAAGQGGVSKAELIGGALRGRFVSIDCL